MNVETNSEQVVIPPEGIPVPQGSRAYKMWNLVLGMPGEIPTREQVINALQEE